MAASLLYSNPSPELPAYSMRLCSVSRAFGPIEVLRDISIDIPRHEVVAIIGPSGCGKTTLLNLLAGDDQPTSGEITRSGRVRMVYQQDGLFPWQTVEQNIALGLRHIHDAVERRRQVAQMVQWIGLEGFEDHYPHRLSGGMRQRVELARSLAGDCEVLLLDEPFSSLDYLTRLRLRGELARLLGERPRTVVLVTHDVEEAAQLADRIVILTERPARVCRELRISSPRPRDLADPEVVGATRIALSELGLELPAASQPRRSV